MKHVVLALLSERPGYGYELQQRLDGRLRFLAASETGIYQLLNRLEGEGLIEVHGAKTIGGTRRGAPRLTYAMTSAGVNALDRWKQAPCGVPPLRDELLVKLALSVPDELPLLLRLAAAQRRAYGEALDRVRSASAVGDYPSGAWPQVVAALVRDVEVARLGTAIGALDRAIELVSTRSPRSEGEGHTSR